MRVLSKLLKINAADNVAVALTDIAKGESAAVGGAMDISVVSLSDIKAGHKVALCDIAKGENAIKYGFSIGQAQQNISKGEWVHSHNIKTNLSGVLNYEYERRHSELKHCASRSFKGYRRQNGKAGIRNEIWIIPTVGCVNSVAEIIERKSQALIKGSVEGIFSFTHPYGCSQLSDDYENTRKALAGLINHPNAGGVLVLGLGCENNGIEGMKDVIGEYDENRVKFLVSQDFHDEVEEGVRLIEQLIEFASKSEREDIPTSELIIGLNCGGSDGFSGITANPLVGEFSNILIAEGGSTILTEVPEMFGAEKILMSRCLTKKEFEKIVSMINGFKEYFIAHNQEIYENPSPGNKEGGITTLEEKSLGCTQKGGGADVVDVLGYGEPLIKKGLNLLYAPGNDLVSATAEVVSGAHLILFTTGRGTPFGSPVPTVKISTNTKLYNSKKNWIDFNAGKLMDGATMMDLSNELYDYVIDLASGKLTTKTEQNGIRDLAIFKNGVTL